MNGRKQVAWAPLWGISHTAISSLKTKLRKYFYEKLSQNCEAVSTFSLVSLPHIFRVLFIYWFSKNVK